ncbi:uncharacterized protein MONOS_13986 [Monocercomonoides exilis]|uniref:uncharacterized protein n=1 Tax=Monocercomonoides exilis TaxID=2049356 RepID=UPI003559DA13|nr:hypothetical protein MONOS_13986 [Monocercomonoides exilis]|eukprot:MONOS_13986.1-p1 / transcript=MONOS_13986.1 / gene=MONOS_13986 / organism=Monocercomonoides_exilis_PA203 / gene_product=unspecified product / transcript_product=unspecified product / location=Mono_scaffold00917:8639-10582(-) / protein_length=327 / sequence_SO=supercontig / SO=protein_coding / is_pseudo=false
MKEKVELTDVGIELEKKCWTQQDGWVSEDSEETGSGAGADGEEYECADGAIESSGADDRPEKALFKDAIEKQEQNKMKASCEERWWCCKSRGFVTWPSCDKGREASRRRREMRCRYGKLVKAVKRKEVMKALFNATCSGDPSTSSSTSSTTSSSLSSTGAQRDHGLGAGVSSMYVQSAHTTNVIDGDLSGCLLAVSLLSVVIFIGARGVPAKLLHDALLEATACVRHSIQAGSSESGVGRGWAETAGGGGAVGGGEERRAADAVSDGAAAGGAVAVGGTRWKGRFAISCSLGKRQQVVSFHEEIAWHRQGEGEDVLPSASLAIPSS